jgi:hypothetical protein
MDLRKKLEVAQEMVVDLQTELTRTLAATAEEQVAMEDNRSELASRVAILESELAGKDAKLAKAYSMESELPPPKADTTTSPNNASPSDETSELRKRIAELEVMLAESADGRSNDPLSSGFDVSESAAVLSASEPIVIEVLCLANSDANAVKEKAEVEQRLTLGNLLAVQKAAVAEAKDRAATIEVESAQKLDRLLVAEMATGEATQATGKLANFEGTVASLREELKNVTEAAELVLHELMELQLLEYHEKLQEIQGQLEAAELATEEDRAVLVRDHSARIADLQQQLTAGDPQAVATDLGLDDRTVVELQESRNAPVSSGRVSGAAQLGSEGQLSHLSHSTSVSRAQIMLTEAGIVELEAKYAVLVESNRGLQEEHFARVTAEQRLKTVEDANSAAQENMTELQATVLTLRRRWTKHTVVDADADAETSFGTDTAASGAHSSHTCIVSLRDSVSELDAALKPSSQDMKETSGLAVGQGDNMLAVPTFGYVLPERTVDSKEIPEWEQHSGNTGLGPVRRDFKVKTAI